MLICSTRFQTLSVAHFGCRSRPSARGHDDLCFTMCFKPPSCLSRKKRTLFLMRHLLWFYLEKSFSLSLDSFHMGAF